MRTHLTSFRTLLAALAFAGGVGVACSHQRHSDTTVAQATPLGQSTADYPLTPSAAPLDAALPPEQPLTPVHTLSPGAAGGTTAPTTGTPTTTSPSGTPTNPNTPPPTGASPNAPSSTPAPNPMPPSGGAPIQGSPTQGTTGTGPTGTEPGPTGTAPPPASPPPTETPAPQSSTAASGSRWSAIVDPLVSHATVPEARDTFDEPLDPYRARSDGGVTPPTTIRNDAGVGPGNRDAGVIGGGGRSDAGVGGTRGDAGSRPGGGIRNDAGVGGAPRGDGGVR